MAPPIWDKINVTREKQIIIIIILKTVSVLFSPSRSSSASSGYKPKWAPLDPPDDNRVEIHISSRELCGKTTVRNYRYVNVFSHSALILLSDGGSSPQGIDTVHRHCQAKVWPRLPTLQPQLLHHRPNHITAALHTRYTLWHRQGKGIHLRGNNT